MSISTKNVFSFFKLPIILIILVLYPLRIFSSDMNGFGMKLYTIETDHFKLNYHEGLVDVAKHIGDVSERLYEKYRNIYDITIPDKCEVLVTASRSGNGWALALQNTMLIDANEFDYHMRGTVNWFENVIAHEYAHIVSINTSFKLPKAIPYIFLGTFSHPNEKYRTEAFHLAPNEILPPWFFEGIAQYESLIHDGDIWDSHRDMILRTMVLSNTMLTWDAMSVFQGPRSDNYEKTYNQGFAITRYIADTYGYDKVVAILKESSRPARFIFDKAIKKVLGITGKDLYDEWKEHLLKKYSLKQDSLGIIVEGKKITDNSWYNYWPRFSPHDDKLYFLSNGKSMRMRQSLHSYSFSDTIEDDKRIAVELSKVTGYYDICDVERKILYTSAHSKKSKLSAKKGGVYLPDLYIDTLPYFKKNKIKKSRKKPLQISKKFDAFHASFSPDGKKIAYTKYNYNKFKLMLTDTAGTSTKQLYPPHKNKNDSLSISYIYSVDFSPDSNLIAISYLDRDNRKIGFYNLQKKSFTVLCDTKNDERDPRFNSDGSALYFSSDRTGIFNIYRYIFSASKVEKLTNVAGGAFAPDISGDEKKLAYAGYNKNGYGIYMLDSLPTINHNNNSPKESTYTQLRLGVNFPKLKTPFTPPQSYNRMPRKVLFVPALISEETLTKKDTDTEGDRITKMGGILYLMDPFDWESKGTSVGLYYLSSTFNPTKIFDSEEIINRANSYDLGLFVTTAMLPFDLSFSYFKRGIAATAEFTHDAYGYDFTEVLRYNLNPRFSQLTATHRIIGSIGGYSSLYAAIGSFIKADEYKIWTEIQDKYFKYTPAHGMTLGAYFSFAKRPEGGSLTSPVGSFLRVSYEFPIQYLIDSEKYFSVDTATGTIGENYDKFSYHQFSGTFIRSKPIPFIKRHILSASLEGTALSLTNKTKKRLKEQRDESDFKYLQNDNLPSYYKPGIWIPGYSYYYRDTVTQLITKTKFGKDFEDTATMIIDTVLVSGNAILHGALSYRFPFTPSKGIDKKILFFYLNQIYGVLNFGGATSLDDISAYKKLNRENLLLYCGAELRLGAQIFNSYPFAFSLKWDYGIDKPAPVGGHRFSLNIGLSFDNWGIIVTPDGVENRKFQRHTPRLIFSNRI